MRRNFEIKLEKISLSSKVCRLDDDDGSTLADAIYVPKQKTSPNALLALQLLLAFFSTYSILQDVAEDRPFVVSSKAALVELFFDDSFSSTKRNVAFLYDSKTLIESIEKTVDRYFHLPETS